MSAGIVMAGLKTETDLQDRITALEADLKLARDLVMQMTARVQEWHAEADKWRALAEGVQHKAGSCAPPPDARPLIPFMVGTCPIHGMWERHAGRPVCPQCEAGSCAPASDAAPLPRNALKWSV